MKTNVKSDGQRYAGGELRFPSALWQTPAAERYPELDMGTGAPDDPKIEGYFIDSVSGTKVFAYVGMPENASAETPVPGIVLVHGGGGTAFYEWVSFWVKRGYAAIAMDTEGHMPTRSSRMSNNDHAESVRPHGPANDCLQSYMAPAHEQWAYHAIASVIVSNSFLRSFKEVAPDRIGMTGISYGAFLTCQTAAYDDRFCFAAPVYGSLDQKIGDTQFGLLIKPERCAALWDNNDILQGCSTPFFYLNGDTDTHFSVLATTESDKKTEDSRMLVRHGLLHSHEIGGLMEVREICAFADHFCMGTADLVQITGQPTEEVRVITFCVPEGVNVTGVTAYYTEDRVLDEKAVWIPVEELPFEKNTANINIPDSAAYFYVNITDDRGCEVSSRVAKL